MICYKHTQEMHTFQCQAIDKWKTSSRRLENDVSGPKYNHTKIVALSVLSGQTLCQKSELFVLSGVGESSLLIGEIKVWFRAAVWPP